MSTASDSRIGELLQRIPDCIVVMLVSASCADGTNPRLSGAMRRSLCEELLRRIAVSAGHKAPAVQFVLPDLSAGEIVAAVKGLIGSAGQINTLIEDHVAKIEGLRAAGELFAEIGFMLRGSGEDLAAASAAGDNRREAN